MKQCPNPNCIFYTRLEELPDAYIKCPGCGGMLSEAGLTSGSLPSNSQGRPRAASTYAIPPDLDGPGGAQPDQTYPYSYAQPAQSQQPRDPFAPVAQSDPYAAPYDPYADPYALPPVQQPDPYARAYADPEGAASIGAQTQRARWPTTSRIIVGVSILLFLASCGVVAALFSNRLFPQARVITGAMATETAIASLRPAVNTPIISPPTVTSSGAVIFTPLPQFTQQVSPPTPVPVQPTAQPPPTAVVEQQPTSTLAPVAPGIATPGPTAPPAQPRPSGGVISAQMSVSLEGGSPVGDVSAYGPTDTFNLAVQAGYGPGAVASVVTRWYGPDGALIYEMRRDYPQPGTYYAGFTLKSNGRWIPGNYRVDVHSNDSPVPAYSVEFTVLP